MRFRSALAALLLAGPALAAPPTLEAVLASLRASQPASGFRLRMSARHESAAALQFAVEGRRGADAQEDATLLRVFAPATLRGETLLLLHEDGALRLYHRRPRAAAEALDPAALQAPLWGTQLRAIDFAGRTTSAWSWPEQALAAGGACPAKSCVDLVSRKDDLEVRTTVQSDTPFLPWRVETLQGGAWLRRVQLSRPVKRADGAWGMRVSQIESAALPGTTTLETYSAEFGIEWPADSFTPATMQ